MRSHSPEMTMKLSSSAALSREKYSRNKRKFRQDPPCVSQSSADEDHGGGSNPGEGEGESSAPEPRSPEVVASANSGQKEGARAASETGERSSQLTDQEGFKLTRWFRAGLPKVSARGNLVSERSPGRSADEPSSKAAATDGSEDQEDENEDDEDTDEPDTDEPEEPEDEDEDDEGEDVDDAYGDEDVVNYTTEEELENVLCLQVGSLYREAIAQIAACGRYSAEEALEAVLKCGHCPEGRDSVLEIVKTARMCLNGGQNAERGRARDRGYSDLQALQKGSLEEMLRRVREASGNKNGRRRAMWKLLVSDLNVKAACAIDESKFGRVAEEPSSPTIQSGQGNVGPSSTVSEARSPTRSSSPPALPNAAAASILTQSTAASSLCPTSRTLPPIKSTLALPSDPVLLTTSDPGTASDSRDELEDTPETPPNSVSGNGSRSATSRSAGAEKEGPIEDRADPRPTGVSTSDEMLASGGGPSAESDKNRRALISDAYDVPSPEKLVQCQSPLAELPNEDPVAVNLKESLLDSVNSEDCVEDSSESESKAGSKDSDAHSEEQQPPDSIRPALDPGIAGKSLETSSVVQVEKSDTPPVPLQETVSSPVRFGTVDESAIAMAADREVLNVHVSDCESSTSADDSVITSGSSQSLRCSKLVKTGPDSPTKEVASIEKGEMDKEEEILKLRERNKELENQVQKCTQWANQKVGQAAQRLHKDMQELKSLRLEREENLRLKREKKAFEDSTTKKISEMETAKRDAHGKAERQRALVHKLENENAEVRAEMQAAKLSAAEALSSCEEIAKRERKYVKRSEAWEKQKAELQVNLTEERRKIVALQQELALAKERQHQAEVRWRQEEKAREEANFRADHEKRTKEQAETASKKREDALRRKAEANYKRHKDDIQRLETEMGQFRISAEATQLATSRWGLGVAVSPQIMELSSRQTLKESNDRLSREFLELQDMPRSDVRRERECVMCMCEEMSVVFLPCAHQVVCVKCNDLHEKQGMRDCPSCRTPIKQRIRVYGVST